MEVTGSGYLDTQGFSVILYHSTFNRMFFDQKNTALEMILHGRRIATNGDVRLLPAPEQWDAIPQLKSRNADGLNRRLTAEAGYPEYDFHYRLEAAAEPGGVRVAVILDKPLPERLAGRAGFNLELLPAIYAGKAFIADGATASQPPASSPSCPPPCQGCAAEALRPAWPSWMPIAIGDWPRTAAMVRASAASVSSDQSPTHWGVIRPAASTAVASTKSSPAPDSAICPRWIRCQSVVCPSCAEYWHIGEITMRLGSARPPSWKGANNWLMGRRDPAV